jgi:hypothetical protein
LKEFANLTRQVAELEQNAAVSLSQWLAKNYCSQTDERLRNTNQ